MREGSNHHWGEVCIQGNQNPIGTGFQGYRDQKNAPHKLPAHTSPPTLISTAHHPESSETLGRAHDFPKYMGRGIKSFYLTLKERAMLKT